MKREILEYMMQAMEMGQKIVVDVDDWFEGLSPTNRAYQSTDPEKNPEENRDIYAQIIQNATAVITSTPFLYDFYKAKRDNVYMVRNGIDLDRWRRRQGRMNHRLRLGWVGATPWRSGDLETLAPWIGNYLLSRKMYFHHSGHTENGAARACDQLGIHQNISRIQPLVPINLYPKLFEHIDIGMVPLNDIPFNHAKSFIKGLEYAAAGVPFVSSYSPEYEYLAEHGVGRVARNQDEWIYHLDELRDIQKRRDEIGHNYEMLKNFTMSARANDWNEVMTTILEKK
jgi:glycosyltransferase involved in cell wall biosynthesis